MPKALSGYKKGLITDIMCYEKGCEDVSINNVILGEEHEIHRSFRWSETCGVGRIKWIRGSVMKGFTLGKTLGGSGYCNCPKCRKLFGGVIIVSNGRFKKPTIIGYEPESA